jgi:hypothetical protein
VLINGTTVIVKVAHVVNAERIFLRSAEVNFPR